MHMLFGSCGTLGCPCIIICVRKDINMHRGREREREREIFVYVNGI